MTKTAEIVEMLKTGKKEVEKGMKELKEAQKTVTETVEYMDRQHLEIQRLQELLNKCEDAFMFIYDNSREEPTFKTAEKMLKQLSVDCDDK